MATQYSLTNDFTAIEEESGTIQNVGYESVELVSASNAVAGEGIILMPGEKQAFNGAIKARSLGATNNINVVDFKEEEEGGDIMIGATASEDGVAGLAPAPTAGQENRFLRGDGTWAVPTDEDTQYQPATQSTDGLMSAADKTKLDGIEAGANNYTLPQATASTMGGMKLYDTTGDNTDGAATQGLVSHAVDVGEVMDVVEVESLTIPSAYQGQPIYTCWTPGDKSNKYVATKDLNFGDTVLVRFENTNSASNLKMGDGVSASGQLNLLIDGEIGSQIVYALEWTSNGMQSVNSFAYTDISVPDEYANLKFIESPYCSDSMDAINNRNLIIPYGCDISNGFLVHFSYLTNYTSGSYGTDLYLKTLDDDGNIAYYPNTGNMRICLNEEEADQFKSATLSTSNVYVLKLKQVPDTPLKYLHIEDSFPYVRVEKVLNSKAVTQPTADDSNAIATTAFVKSAINDENVHLKLTGGTLTGELTAPSFTGDVTGNCSGAAQLTTARTIDGVDFNGTAAITHYGSCSTSAGTAAKTVACTGFKLVTGSRISVKFTETNTADNPTLNVNSTGDKAIYYRGAAISKGYLAANRTYTFVYNGTQYEFVGDINTDTNTATAQNISTTNATYPILLGYTANATANIGNKAALFGSGIKANPSTSTITATTFSGNLSGNAATATTLKTARTIDGVDFNGSAAISHYGTCSTAAGTAAKTVSCTSFKLVTGARIIVKFTVTNTASSPTLNVNSTGAKNIYYRGSAITAGLLAANRVIEFVYTGSQYEAVGNVS